MAKISIPRAIFPILTLLATPAAAQAVAGAPASPTPAADEVATGLDRSLRMTVPVMINGQGPFDFVVDTGADRTVISEELAKQLSLDRSTVSNMLRLLELAEPVKQSLRSDKISAGHARALLSLTESDQIVLCQRIMSDSLSVRATEAAVRETLAAVSANGSTVPFDKTSDVKSKPQPTQHVLSLQSQLRDLLGLPVEIKLKGKESGQVVITFQSNDDFERILRMLRRAA